MTDQARTDAVTTSFGEATGPAQPRRRAALVALAAAQFMVVLDSSIVNVALPSIRTALGLTATQVSWVIDGYLVAFGGLLLLGGRLADVLRRRPVFMAGLAVFMGGSATCALAASGPVLIGARVAQGAGGAVMAPAALSIVLALFPETAARSRALGVWGGISGAGGIAGVLLGGVLSQALGWPWIFWINVPVGLAVAAVVAWSVRPRPAAGGTFDSGGAFTITLALAALAFGLVSGPHIGWSTGVTLAAFAVAATGLIAFVTVERRVTHPLVPLLLFTRTRLVTANAIMFLVGGVMVGLFYFLPQYQQVVLGMSPIRTSVAQLPIAVTITACGLLAPRIAAAIGVRVALVCGLTSLTGGLLWLATDAGRTFAGLIGPFVLAGVGIGVTSVYVTTLAVDGSAPDESGLVSGLVNATRQMGGALGLAALVAVAGGRAFPPHFRAAFAMAAGLAALALVLSLTPALRRGLKTVTREGDTR